MNKKFSILLLMLTSQVRTKELINTDDLLKSTNTKKVKPVIGHTKKSEEDHKPGDLFRYLADHVDKMEKVTSASWKSFEEEMDDLWKNTKTKAGKIQQSFSSRPLILQDQKDKIVLTSYLGDIAPDKDLNIHVENNTFRIEVKQEKSIVHITGTILNNILTTQVSREYKDIKNPTRKNFSEQSAMIQRTIMGKLDLEKLSANFTKVDKILTIIIPKKKTHEEMRKVTVTVK